MSDLPHATDTSPDWLFAEIDRSFGSMEDFRRVLREQCADVRRGKSVHLICTPQGSLRLLHEAPHGRAHGNVLMTFAAAHDAQEPTVDLRLLALRYLRYLQTRPPYPLP